MEQGRIVVNEQTGDKAWWNGKDLTPIRIEPGTTGVEPGVPMTITDEPAQPRGRVVTNEQGQKAWWDGTNLKPLAVGQAEQMQSDVAESAATGKSLTGTPAPEKVEPMKEPLWMEKHGLPKPPGSEFQKKVSDYAIPIGTAALQMTPVGRTAKAAIGGAGAALEDISEGRMPSVGSVALGIGSSLVPEAVMQAGKWGLRTMSKTFGRAPLIKGAEASAAKVLKGAPSVPEAAAQFETTKHIARPVVLDASSRVATEANQILSKGMKQGIEPEVEKALQKELTDIGQRVTARTPLSYGDVFARARHMNDMAQTAKTTQGRNTFYKIHDAYLDDLVQHGPEAAEAVKTYKVANRAQALIKAAGRPGGDKAMKALTERSQGLFTPKQLEDVRTIQKHLGSNWEAHLSRAAAISGAGSMFVAGVIPGALPLGSITMSALVRLGKPGVAIARSLVSPEGTISKNVAPAIGQAIRGYLAEEQNGND